MIIGGSPAAWLQRRTWSSASSIALGVLRLLHSAAKSYVSLAQRRRTRKFALPLRRAFFDGVTFRLTSGPHGAPSASRSAGISASVMGREARMTFHYIINFRSRKIQYCWKY
jgi:hypothetical protein